MSRLATKLRPQSKGASANSISPPTASKILTLGDAWIICVLVGAVFASYLPTFRNGFVDWDDTGMFVENFHYRGLAWENIKWMFTTNHYAHYHPITWLTLGLDYVLWGMNPVGYHFQSLAWHAANAVLLFVLLRMLFAPSSGDTKVINLRISCAVGALFFAIHPLRVESVAWATERRDVVSGFFYLLTLIAYVRANQSPRRRMRWIFVAFISFVLSFFSKAWAITLPIVLLLLDVYPLRRISVGDRKPRLKPALVEKIPFLFVALVLALIALKGQSQWGIKAENFGIFKRLANAAYGLVFYPWKTFVPVGLSPIYPLDPDFNPLEGKYVVSFFIGLGITAAAWVFRMRWPWVLTAWISYAVIVSPVLGLAQSGEQIAADRYTYLACLPFAAVVGLAMLWLLQRHERQRLFIIAGATGIVITMGSLTFAQTKIWHDDLALWSKALDVDPDNFVARNGRGKLYLDRGEPQFALADFDAAIRLNPRRVAPYTNRGMIHHMEGRFQMAMADYNKSIELDPQYQTFNNRAALRETQGDLAGAIDDYTNALRLKDTFVTAYFNRARLRQRLGDLDGAGEDFDLALRFKPDYLDAYFHRGRLRRERGDERAANDFAAALQLAAPDWPHRQEVKQILQSLQP
jgi:tetratricopeptide (TPR) repeat protein